MFHSDFEVMELSRFTCDGDKFPISVYYSNPQLETNVHRHEFVELVLILSGKGIHSVEQTDLALSRGDICVIPRGVNHSYKQVSEDFSLINILFIPEMLPIPGLDVMQLPGFKPILTGYIPDEKYKYISFHVDEDLFEFLETLSLQLVKEHEELSPGKSFVSLGIFMTLIGKLARRFSSESRFSSFDYEAAAKVISYLNKNYREEVSIAKMCKIGGMSKSTLMRNFKKTAGVSPLQYMIGLRLGEAAVLLRSTEKSYWEIAAAVGFNDANYLGRQFKQVYGVTLGTYRKRYRQISEK